MDTTSGVNNADTGRAFFEACEAGQGWEGCSHWCHDDASFSCQSQALAGVSTLAGYCDWMKDLLGPISDGRHELTAFAADAGRHSVVAAAVFHGTHSADGGPVPPTGRTIAADYVYVMQFEHGRIAHLTKIWNDAHSLGQLGWA